MPQGTKTSPALLNGFSVIPEDDRLNGTYLLRDIELIPSKVVAVFGKGNKGDEYKVSKEWCLTKDGAVFTLYDWKMTKLYDDNYEYTPAEFWAIDDLMELHIGGKRENAKLLPELIEMLKASCGRTPATPAPWHIDYANGYFILDENKGGIVEQLTERPEAEANALLIAAAPDLLAACEYMISLIKEHKEIIPTDALVANEGAARMMKAIEKARGI